MTGNLHYTDPFPTGPLLAIQLLQVKLFKEWNAKWPEDYKFELREKIVEIDSNFAGKLSQEIFNGYSNGNGSVGSGTSSPTDQAPPIAELQNEAIVA